jgi:hypothetical protein
MLVMPSATEGHSNARPASHEMRSAMTAENSAMNATVIGRRSQTRVHVDGSK